MKVKLLHMTEDPLLLMTKAADQSYDTSHEDYEGIIKKIIELGHLTVLEHAHATFEISGISRACSHQLVRHRLLSLVQRSQRYVDEENFNYIVPPDIASNKHERNIFVDAMDVATGYYKALRREGIKKEDARFVLPNACETSMVVTTNFREWKYIIDLRTKPDAQWEIRELMNRIKNILKDNCPVVFDD